MLAQNVAGHSHALCVFGLQVLSLWLWLSYRFRTGAFPEQAGVVGLATKLIGLMDEGLQVCCPAAFQFLVTFNVVVGAAKRVRVDST